MHTVHSGFTIAARINNNEVDKLTNFVRKLQQDNLLDLENAVSTLYASIVLLPSQKYEQEDLPTVLMFSTSFSGPFKIHLDELLNHCGILLGELFSYCVEFPENGKASRQILKKFMLKYRHSSTFYSGLHGITATAIRQEEQLRKEIVLYINKGQEQNEFNGLGACQIKERIEHYISNMRDQYAWPDKAYSRTTMDFLVLYWKAITFVAIFFLLLSSPIFYCIFRSGFFLVLTLLLVGSIVFAAVAIPFIERGKQAVAGRLPDDQMRVISASQSNPIVNEMTAAGPVKEGYLRRLIFIAVLKIVSYLHGTITIPTVCTARWVALDAGKRLVFISNFTNQSDSYVRDFIDSPSSARGINLLFGHGEGYPKTKWLVLGGNMDNPEGFMNVLHKNQHVTQYWYAPFKNLTVDIIINNRKIRNGLFRLTNPDDVQKWLNLL